MACLVPRLRRRLPNEALPLFLLRGLVVLASLVWLALAPAVAEQPGLVTLLLAAFALYGTGMLALLWVEPTRALRWNVVVLTLDLGFALAVIRLTGGARSVFFLALYLIAALQAYQYGTRRGIVVTVATILLYLAVV